MPRKSKHPCRGKLDKRDKKGCTDPKRNQRHYEKLIARYNGYLEEIRAGNKTPGRKRKAATETTPMTDAEFKPTDSDKRVVVKFYYERLGCPPEEDWDSYDGTIARIRRDIGKGAPCPASVRNTLLRLVDGDEDIAASRRGGNGRQRTLSEEDDLYIGLLACEGHSQRTVTLLMNAERKAKGQPLVDRKQIRDAEQRVEVWRRRRQKHKSGSADVDSDWAKASKALCIQLRGQFRAGEAAAAARDAKPFTLQVGNERVKCTAADPWSVITRTINVLGAWWTHAAMSQKDKKRSWPCELVGYAAAYNWSKAPSPAPAYVIEQRDAEYGTHRYMMRPSIVWELALSQDERSAIEARVNGPPPLVPEQILVLDEKHK
eukprot:7386676-Prymnesium_polylepis.1